MWQPWRVQVRQVEEALTQGRLEEAGQLLDQGALSEFLPAQRLRERLAQEVVARGREKLRLGATLAGWQDWELAARYGAAVEPLGQLERELIARTLDEIRGLLTADDPPAARRLADELLRRDNPPREARHLAAVAAKADQAKDWAARGEFARAEQLLAEAAALEPGLPALDRRRGEYHDRGQQHRRLSRELHERQGHEQWSQALAVADEILALAPDDVPAREARRRAWQAVGTHLGDTPARPPGAVTPVGSPRSPRAPAAARDLVRAVGEDHTVSATAPRPPRFLLWVDAVGGYLVCPASDVVLGQAVPGHRVDVPLLGDLSARQAIIHRGDEGYWIEPCRPIRVGGQPTTGPTLLADGAVIELGSGVALRFRQPHPLSASARLELVSRHRTQPPVDGVLLMAESLVLGPSRQAHVECRDWTREAVLFTEGGELRMRTTGPWEVDGRPAESPAALTLASRVAGEDFSLTLEQLADT